MPSIVLSPKVSETSAQNLAAALGWEWENPYETGRRNYKNYKNVFKYGFSSVIEANRLFNKTKAIHLAIDKIKTYEALKNTDFIIQYTKDHKVAEKWIKDKHCVVARTISDGKNGEGVTFVDTIEEFNIAPANFWTKYINHTNEFRVNIWKDKVISIYDKKRVEDNFAFVLYKGQENQPQLVELVKEVYTNIGLDWCGLDVVVDKSGKLHLLEVNSAPVLYPYTLKKLVECIKGDK